MANTALFQKCRKHKVHGTKSTLTGRQIVLTIVGTMLAPSSTTKKVAVYLASSLEAAYVSRRLSLNLHEGRNFVDAENISAIKAEISEFRKERALSARRRADRVRRFYAVLRVARLQAKYRGVNFATAWRSVRNWTDRHLSAYLRGELSSMASKISSPIVATFHTLGDILASVGTTVKEVFAMANAIVIR